jgi:cellulose synthase/poly-beta-1,6-N-acetylglucosamine synthase-like glycosyltransferase
MEIIVIICITIYIFTLFILLITSFSTSEKNIKTKYPSVSIIIPFRNEETNIPSLLSDLQHLDYPESKLEIILTNDHSTDHSYEIITSAISKKEHRFSIKLTTLPQNKTGKKEALIHSASESNGTLLLFTDADCHLQPTWVKSMTTSFRNDIKMVLGRVELSGNSFLQKLQTLEFWALMRITHSAVELKKPFLANGANLLIEKSVFLALSHELKKQYASGDDVFLLQAVYNIYGADAITFNNKQKATVYTNGKHSFSEFLQQRQRWASKTKGMTLTSGYLFALLLSLGNIALLLSFLVWNLDFFFRIFLLKWGIEALFILPDVISQKRTDLLILTPFISILYPFYQAYIIFTKNTTIQWKGRNIKH